MPSTHSLTLPRRRCVTVAERLMKLHPHHAQHHEPSGKVSAPNVGDIRVVCISDTHGHKPDLPPGDILIHAGDATEYGSFDEFQAQLDWLSSQPHSHKILIAGNHDVILDEEFLAKYPRRRYGQSKTNENLNWGSVTYLQDSSTTVQVEGRKILIYGSPQTPRYGVSAFQYDPSDDIWHNAIPDGTDIIVTHGPSYMHLDAIHFRRAGCPFLAAEVARVRPRLVVCGHIHAAHGTEDVVLDGARRAYEEMLAGWSGWDAVLKILLYVVSGNFGRVLSPLTRDKNTRKITKFVNAAAVAGPMNELRNEPTQVWL